jgi:phosphinothricin acetyltransferase
MDFSIRLMVPPDWPAVRATYLEGIATGNVTFEIEGPLWERWDAAHSAVCRL